MSMILQPNVTLTGPGAPVNVQLQVFGHSVHLSWNPPLEPNGYIEQYDIEWAESGSDEEEGRDFVVV